MFFKNVNNNCKKKILIKNKLGILHQQNTRC